MRDEIAKINIIQGKNSFWEGVYMKGAYITYNNSLRLVQCWRHSARAWAPVLPILLPTRLHMYVNSNKYNVIIIIVPDLGNYVCGMISNYMYVCKIV